VQDRSAREGENFGEVRRRSCPICSGHFAFRRYCEPQGGDDQACNARSVNPRARVPCFAWAAWDAILTTAGDFSIEKGSFAGARMEFGATDAESLCGQVEAVDPLKRHENTHERGGTVMTSESRVCVRHVPVLALVVMAAMLSGCQSKQELALDQAKKQAAATGQAQQVVSVDKNGTTTTTVVQPPAAGQTNEATSTVTAPPVAGAPVPKPSGPVVSAVPPPPPVPVNVSIPAGTTLTIRIDQRISAKASRAGDSFTGEIVDPVLAGDNSVLVPKGARVGGVVDASHRRGHFKGSSLLELRLTSLTLNGQRYPLATRDLARTKKGKGRRSTALIAGGSGIGMLIGGLAGGGVGVAAGGLAGGGAGTAVAGLTGNRDLEIPAESIVHFKLAEDLVVQPAQ